MGFLIRMAITALGLWLASRLVPGVSFESPITFVFAALWLGEPVGARQAVGALAVLLGILVLTLPRRT